MTMRSVRLLTKYSPSMRALSTSRKLLEDSFGRKHDYLRISLTEKCNLRCRYCMPEEGIKLTPQDDLLSLSELKRLANIFVKSCGVSKIRLTGGEPTIDRKLLPLIGHLNLLRADGLDKVALTTNGISLKRHAPVFKQLGLNGLNISLDTLREERFELITRRKGLKLVLEGLKIALDQNFDSIKLNCVMMKDLNDDELVQFAELALAHPIEVRFIEFMPFAGNRWSLNLMLPYKEMFDRVHQRFPDLKQVSSPREGGTSRVFSAPTMKGSIGFISSMSDNFCSTCNRLRITSDGNLKVCLFGREETSLKDLIRNGASDGEIVRSIASALSRKKRQHAGFNILEKSSSRPMITIAARRHYNRESRPAHLDQKVAFSHLSAEKGAKMVHVGEKKVQRRVALAEGRIFVGDLVMRKLVEKQTTSKGDILTVSKLAGIMGAKRTSSLIPLCHQIALDVVDIDLELCEASLTILVRVRVEATHKTGVEMESLTAVSVALLTIYDMCKSINKTSMSISDIRLVSKTKEDLPTSAAGCEVTGQVQQRDRR